MMVLIVNTATAEMLAKNISFSDLLVDRKTPFCIAMFLSFTGGLRIGLLTELRHGWYNLPNPENLPGPHCEEGSVMVHEMIDGVGH